MSKLINTISKYVNVGFIHYISQRVNRDIAKAPALKGEYQ